MSPEFLQSDRGHGFRELCTDLVLAKPRKRRTDGPPFSGLDMSAAVDHRHGGSRPSGLSHQRPVIFSGTTHWSNCSAVRWPEAIAASRRLEPSLCAFLAMAAALS